MFELGKITFGLGQSNKVTCLTTGRETLSEDRISNQPCIGEELFNLLASIEMSFSYLGNHFPLFSYKTPCLYPVIGTQFGFLPESVPLNCISVIADKYLLPLTLAFCF